MQKDRRVSRIPGRFLNTSHSTLSPLAKTIASKQILYAFYSDIQS
jgi:hypothetical protein